MPAGQDKKGILAVISAPSGTGKSTLCRKLIEKSGYRMSVSATTRKPRGKETDGQDYHFISEEKFQEMIDSKEFLEYAKLFSAWYGTPLEPVNKAIRSGEVILLDIDIQGAMQIKDGRLKDINSVFIFVVPPSEDELERRIRSRGENTDQEIRQRLCRAREEMQFKDRYDHVVVNDNVGRAADEIISVIERKRKK